MHIIKQKPHHRFFDATARRYISVRDVRCLADSGEEIHVLDGRTGRDVTRRVLPRLLREAPEATAAPGWARDVAEAGATIASKLLAVVTALGHGLEALAGALHPARASDTRALRARRRRPVKGPRARR